ncbi:hypothetical protein QN372_03135 [Undibacterium sp. RTI2.1]|uniref:hypothetical protein n=1 Tax=unclassified Undibacterium TaxID=2630295 RepID=UPI002AB4936F|nr:MULTISPECIES: hypothetical protein [unclassified Undibacterium]MDY7540606.1 hypothetical protein [Undibacterium sp. 5I1]MEB0029730.1 hypothetical protein [Undibacterium sp. RTI2.1]MEB0117478.1 hypothetical protein [Undibacterium sp. RTI2.2]MEB0230783.1 hypothetical protein [Undibacterium sp. 10I3]MEB0256572.1 hypothetical protein [Undibacterium sp. 5I1]
MNLPSFCRNKASYIAIIVAIVTAISSSNSKAAEVPSASINKATPMMATGFHHLSIHLNSFST